ncbi:MAG: polysaccharide biosynthesis C-terminal domain-containing protein [Flavobacteriales bacterium]|nr:polysaccharide biosynthesis C-terminal domain-containing protein [Flavobacteriales bacterium]
MIRRQSAFSSIAMYIGIALGFVLSLFVYPRYLVAEEIGLVRVLVDMAKLISPFLLLGIPGTFVRYYPYFSKDENAAAAFRYLSLLVTGVGTIFALLLFYFLEPILVASFAEKSPLLSEFFVWLPILIFLVGGISLLRAYYRSDFNITIPNVYEVIVLKVFFIGAVLVYFYMDLSVDWLVYMYIFSHALIFLGLLITYARNGRLRLNKNLSLIDPKLRKEMITYGLFVIANMVSGSMIVNIDSWMLASLSGLSATGIYAIALSIGMVIELPRRSITQIAVPVIANAWKNNNMDNIRDIYHKTSLNQLIAGGVIFILVWTNVDDLFRLIPNGELYSAGKWVVFFIGISKLFSIATGCNIEILQVSEHYRYSLWTRIILIATAIVTNLYFIPRYGITGAAIATAISFLSNNIILYLIVWIKLGLQPFKRTNLYALLWLGIMYLIAAYLPYPFEHPLVLMGLRTVVVGALFLLIVMRFDFSEDLKQFILLALKKAGLRK